MHKHYSFENKIYCSDKIYQYTFGASPYSCKGKLHSFIVKEMFIEIIFKEVRVLKNLFPMTCNFEGHTEIVEIYMMIFSVINGPKIMRFSKN